MADYPHVLYDSATFATTAAGALTLFRTATNVDSSHPKYLTNMPGSGELPSNFSMQIWNIGVTLHDALVLADITAAFDNSYLELFLNNQSIFIAPLRLLAKNNAYGGHFELASAAAQVQNGLMGFGMDLRIPLVIPSQVPFHGEICW